jgi:hypothetical protein
MTIYKGHWEQLPPNPKYLDQTPTAYIRASAGTQEEIRDRLDTWSTSINIWVTHESEDIKEEFGCSIADARKVAWHKIDSALQGVSNGEPIGVDPKVYTTKYIVDYCQKELTAKQNNGRLKDIKKSIVDRHNWQVVHWAYAKFGIETPEQVTNEHLDWIEDRVIDVQTNPETPRSRGDRAVDSIFGE